MKSVIEMADERARLGRVRKLRLLRLLIIKTPWILKTVKSLRLRKKLKAKVKAATKPTAPRASHRTPLLSNNAFWLGVIALIALTFVFGTTRTIGVWWPSEMPVRKILYWTIVTVGVVFIIGAIIWLTRKAFDKKIVTGEKLGNAAEAFWTWLPLGNIFWIAVIVGGVYFLYLHWPTTPPSRSSLRAVLSEPCTEIDPPAPEQNEVVRYITAEPGVWTERVCFPSGGYHVNAGAESGDANLKVRTNLGKEYMLTPNWSDQIAPKDRGYTRWHTYMALGGKPEVIKIRVYRTKVAVEKEVHKTKPSPPPTYGLPTPPTTLRAGVKM